MPASQYDVRRSPFNNDKKRGKKKVVPSDEKDLALLAILRSGEIEVIDSIAALILRHAFGETVVSFFWIPNLIYRNLLSLLINFEHNKPISSFCFQLQKLELALIAYVHPRR